MTLIDGTKTIGYFGLSFDDCDRRSFDFIFKNTEASHCIFYYEESKNQIIENVQKIIGPDYYSSLIYKGKLKFIQSSCLKFVDKN